MFKKFLSSILTVVFVMSMIPAVYAEQPRTGETLKDFYSSLSFTGMSGGSFGGGAGRGFGGGLTIKGAGAGRETGSSFGGGAGRGDWGSGFKKNYGLTFTGSGAKNNFQYNDISSVTNITIANTTNNTFYNPVTNNYNTYNNISYNNTYNTYFIQGGSSNTSTTYDTYITNNATYISYYIIDNSLQETYYYEIYYQLPDGRNSYDLEPEDVWGTYFIYNATNYRSVAEDDGITLGLWHLDGNYHNDAYYQDIVPQFGSSNFVSSDYSWNGALTCSFDVIPFPDTSDYTVEFRANTAGGELSIQLPIYKNYIYNSDGWTVTSRAQHFVNGYLVGFGPSLTSECWFDSGHTTKTLTVSQLADPIVVSGSNSWVSVSVVKEGNKVSCYIDGQKKDISFSSPDPYVYYTDRGFVPPDDYADSPRSCLFSNSRIDHKTSPECSESFTDFSKSVPAFSGSGVLDELRLSNKVLYTENYTPRTQPFDTNKVLVVPDPATMTDTTIAVKSSVPVGALRVGGVRPTFPGNGDVYVVEEKGIVKDVQQYQQDGWYSVQASLYIDGEWKLFVGFDISGFGLNKPDSSGGGTGPGGSGDSGGGSGGDSGGGGSGFWDKLLQSTFGGILSVLASLLSGLLTLLGAILTMLLGIVGYIGIFLPFLPGSIVTLIGGGVFIVLALVVIKFIGGLL